MGKGISCVYCDGRAVAPGCVDPPLCDGHLVVVQAVSRMQRQWGMTMDEITPGFVRTYLLVNWVPGFDLDEVVGLCASMPEFVT